MIEITINQHTQNSITESEALLLVEVPNSITPRQARLILLQYGLLDEIEAMVATDRAMGIWWEYSLDIVRTNEHIMNAGAALGLSVTQLDQMFIEGSKL